MRNYEISIVSFLALKPFINSFFFSYGFRGWKSIKFCGGFVSSSVSRQDRSEKPMTNQIYYAKLASSTFIISKRFTIGLEKC